MIASLDHLVLTARDMAATIDFYTRGLGMTLETFGAGRQALAGIDRDLREQPVVATVVREPARVVRELGKDSGPAPRSSGGCRSREYAPGQ